MSKKTDRELNGPSWTEVILGAFLSLVLGVALAAVAMVLKPAAIVKELPKEPDPGVVYYVEGSRDTAKGRQAVAKQKAFLEGGSVVLNEDELNLLTAPSSTPLPPAKPAAKGAAPEAPLPPAEAVVTAGAPNFRMRGEVLQVGVPVRLSVAGLDEKVVVQARGKFEKNGELFVFSPSEIYVGSCPLQRLPVVRSYLLKRFLAQATIPDDLAAAWRKLENVTVENGALHLTMP